MRFIIAILIALMRYALSSCFSISSMFISPESTVDLNVKLISLLNLLRRDETLVKYLSEESEKWSSVKGSLLN